MLSVLSDRELDIVAGGGHRGVTNANTVVQIVSISIGQIVADHGTVILAVFTNGNGGNGGGGGRFGGSRANSRHR